MLHVAALTRVARIGPSPSGKAPGFGPGIRGFESLRSSQVLYSNRLVQSGWAVYLYDLVYCIDTPYLCAYILRRSSAKCIECEEYINL